ncbi:hypothetical protein Pcinc_040184, partial [Petrolisthes cinctipes]
SVERAMGTRDSRRPGPPLPTDGGGGGGGHTDSPHSPPNTHTTSLLAYTCPALSLLQAQVRLQQKQYWSSEELLEGVLRESPGHQEALYHLSLLYAATNRTGEALAAATEAAGACREPGDTCATLHAHHADLLHTRSFTHQAVTSYQLAVRMEPHLSRAHLNLGAIYHTQGEYELAWEHYHTALDQDPTNPLLLDNIQKLRRAMSARGR